MSDPVSFGDALRRVLGRLGVPDVEVLLALEGEWRELAGPLWGEHTRPLVLRNGELVVEATTPQAVSMLKYAVGDLQRALDQRFGEGVVESIRLQAPGRRGL